ncbi:hypothetical protein MKW94_019671 [Papaver nudicaule]|uniref:Protein kinase domain-containing protein n=1 Tax=Papaver nudicaule TaxID=74823 RepID=A0AA41V486_PAPNU|nr:hypothetical protein [Papaver nudicaule]
MHDRIRSIWLPELRDRFSRNPRVGFFSEYEIRGWCRQIFLALATMHRPGGYIHRDLKPDNLLVSKDGYNIIKIADFGQAREFDSQSPCTDYVTARAYRAPEVLLNSESYNSAVDMWAVGAIMAELYSFCILFPGLNTKDQLKRICSVIGSPTHESWPEGIQLANLCGYEFPEVPIAYAYGLKAKIPSASCVALDLIKSLLSWDPKKRPTAGEALNHPYFSPGLCAPPPPEMIPSVKIEQPRFLFQPCISAEPLPNSFPVGNIRMLNMFNSFGLPLDDPLQEIPPPKMQIAAAAPRQQLVNPLEWR